MIAWFVVVVVFAVVIALAGAFLGYYVNYFDKSCPEKPSLFYKYKYFRKRRIPIAAWEIVAGVILFYVGYEYRLSPIKFVAGVFVANITNYVFIMTIAVLVVLLWLFKTTSGAVTREYVKAAYRKVCPLVVVDVVEPPLN